MLNITIDTCVWFELLKVDFNNEDNLFEEFCFWIENKHLNHIVPTNIISEWNRHKLEYQDRITTYFINAERDRINLFKNNREISSTYNPEIIRINVQKRIERIDLILNTHSEMAPFDDAILNEAAKRSLNTLAPNHKKDSFRDTVNILSLINHLKNKAYPKSIFTTLNYTDFSASERKRYDLHEQLVSEFGAVNLEYSYFDEQKNFGGRLFNELRSKHSLPSFQTYLKEKRDSEVAQAFRDRRNEFIPKVENPDKDYLENIKHIDAILSKKTQTEVDQEIIRMLINRHDSYKQYFFRNIGDNGVV